MATVTQTDSRSHINTDPLRSFKYRVLFDNPNLTSLSPQFGFMSIDGLSVTTDVISYRQGGHNTTALPLDAPILTVSGWKANGDIEIGDRVIDPYGHDSKVVGIYPGGVKDVYRVTMQDGSQAVACWGHLWEIQTRDTNNKRITEVVSTLEMKNRVEKNGYQVLLPKLEPFAYDPVGDLPIHPYVLGVLLAEGYLSEDCASFGSGDDEVVERVASLLPEGHKLVSHGVKHRISVGNGGGAQTARNTYGRNLVLAALRDMGLLGKRSWEKSIPEQYLHASVEERTELLRGLMDGDGSIKADGNIRYASASEDLILGIQELIRSLGGRARVVLETDRTYEYKGEVRKCRDVYWINGVCGMTINPFHLTRKAERFVYSAKSDSYARRVVNVEYAGAEEVQCLEVSAPSHLFIAYDCVPSHNTQKLPGQSDFAPVTFSKGVCATKDDVGIVKWLQDIFVAVQGSGANDGSKNFRSTVTIYLIDHPVTSSKAAVKAAWRIYRAWPTSIAFGSLDAGANGVLMQQMSLAHEGWEVKIATQAGGPASSVGF